MQRYICAHTHGMSEQLYLGPIAKKVTQKRAQKNISPFTIISLHYWVVLVTFVMYQFYLGVFCIANHPVSKVCVMGDVVLIDRKHNFIGYGGTFTYWNKEIFVLGVYLECYH